MTKDELEKENKFLRKEILKMNEIIDGLMTENKTYREHYWNCRAEMDKGE